MGRTFKSGDIWLLLVALVFLVVGISLPIVFEFVHHDTNKRATDTYNAWVKCTGNPRKLTFQEFNLLADRGVLPQRVPDIYITNPLRPKGRELIKRGLR